MELEESHKRRMEEQGELLVEVDTPAGVNSTTLLDTIPQGDGEAMRDSTAAVWGSEQDDTEYALASEFGGSGAWGSNRSSGADNLGASPARPVSEPISPAQDHTGPKPLSMLEEEGAGDSSVQAVTGSVSPLLNQKDLNEVKRKSSKSSFSKSDRVGVIRKESMDDSAVVERRKLSFRSELANRIMVTSHTLSRSTMNLTSFANEVEMYYDYLLEDAPSDLDEDCEADDEGYPDPYSIIEIPNGKKDKKDKKGKNKTTKDRGKPPLPKDKQGTSKLNKRPSILKSSIEPGADKTNRASVRLPSSGGEGGDNPTASDISNVSSPAGTLRSTTLRSPGGGGFIRGSGGRASMSRKANTNNAVIVLSGGDGYCDLDMSRSQFKTDDACVQLWLYKY